MSYLLCFFNYYLLALPCICIYIYHIFFAYLNAVLLPILFSTTAFLFCFLLWLPIFFSLFILIASDVLFKPFYFLLALFFFRLCLNLSAFFETSAVSYWVCPSLSAPWDKRCKLLDFSPAWARHETSAVSYWVCLQLERTMRQTVYVCECRGLKKGCYKHKYLQRCSALEHAKIPTHTSRVFLYVFRLLRGT
jgi:hypothetical protein